jgi:hypothetical protein
MQQIENQIAESTQSFVAGCWGVRYQVKDVQRAIAFYTETYEGGWPSWRES